MKTILTFLMSFCFVALSFGQIGITGDLRTAGPGTGNWDDNTTWLFCVGGPIWVPSGIVPGSGGASNTVTIDHAVVLNTETPPLLVDVVVSSGGQLTINNPGKLIIAPVGILTSDGTLTNNVGSSGLILESDASGAAQLLNSSAINLTREVYVSGGVWHLVGSPIDGAPTSVFGGCWMQQHDPTVAFPGDPWIWNDEGGFDATMDRGNGYSIYSTDAGVYTFTGSATASDVPRSLINGANGYNLVSNPYVCGLSWDANIGLTNVHGNMQVWDPTGAGSYLTKGTGDGYVIPAMQGFFVNTTGASPSITLKSGNRVVTSNDNILKQSEEAEDFILLTVNNISNSYFDEARISFDENGSESYSYELDLKKLYGSEESPDLYILSSDEQDVVYKSLPYSLTSAVKLNLKSQVDAEYEISISDLALSFDVDIYLEDVLEGETILLDEESVYSFSSLANANENRFLLHFVGITGLNEEVNNDFAIFSSYSNLVIEAKSDLSYTVKVVNLLGQEVFESSKLKGDQRINLSDYQNDVVIVNLITESGSISKKVILK